MSDAEPSRPLLGLFEGYGIEVEYMIVDRKTLAVLPIAQSVLERLGKVVDGAVALGPIAWSNELAAHVLELKTNGPVAELDSAAEAFVRALSDMDELLISFDARLMPGGMHPWMDPNREFELYPVDDEGYYQTFDRIFDCRGHGWSNLQSMHINLPFRNDAEFRILHSTSRLLLPLLPALAASSPFAEAERQTELDHRLAVYSVNAARVPSVSGLVVPQHIESRAEYELELLGAIYAELAPHDPEGLLRYEWVNARGCIARFDRMALEIRVLDNQECPRADIAVASAVSAVLRHLCEDPSYVARSKTWSEQSLATLLWEVARDGDEAVIRDPEYLALWGLPGAARSAGEIWQALLSRLPKAVNGTRGVQDAVGLLNRGCLARRLVRAAGQAPSPQKLRETYRNLCDCLAQDRFFEGL